MLSLGVEVVDDVLDAGGMGSVDLRVTTIVENEIIYDQELAAMQASGGDLTT